MNIVCIAKRRLRFAASIIPLSIAPFLPIISHAQQGFAQDDVSIANTAASTTTTENGTANFIPLEEGRHKYIFTDARGVVTSYMYNEHGQIL